MKYTNKQILINRTTYNTHIEEFNSIIEFTNHLSDNPTVSRHFREDDRSSDSTDSYFSKTSSYGEALTLLSKGWLPQAESITKKLKANTPYQAQGTKQVFSTVGFQASVPRYLQGIPTNMISRVSTPKKQKIIVLNRDFVYNSGWSAEKIEEQGIKALQVVQGLEAQGYRVRLNVVSAIRNSNEATLVKITIKKPEEPLQLSKIAFPLAHPSMLRRMMFRFIEQNRYLKTSFRSGYGTPFPEILRLELEKGEYLLPATIPDDYVETILANQ